MKKTHLISMPLLVLALVSCTRGKTRQETARVVKVDTVRIYREGLKEHFPGKVKAGTTARLSFKVSGKIARALVDAGDTVRQGETLAVMDDRDYKLQLAATDAEYLGIKAEAERIIALHASGSVASNDRDKAVHGLQQITAKREAHANALEDTRLVAPFAGRVQQRFREAGEIVGAGTPVFSIVGDGLAEVEIRVAPSTVARRGQVAGFSCTSVEYPGKTFALDLVSVTPGTGLDQLHAARLRTRDGAGGRLSPGTTVTVEIRYNPRQPALFSLPYPALFERDDRAFVWIYDPGRRAVSSREVEVAAIERDGSVLLSGGVEEGEIVITAGARSLNEGDAARPLTVRER
ncbi:MAG: efflux RND transporter periplasmic adaptor subunit [Odoribacteraceae bacterium]|nr:efflux RND transporter periplasmic adaptor subunit [Odoribacteraceae bacterium]